MDVDAEEGLMMETWIDPYMGRRYEGDWISTGYHFYDRKSGRPAEHDAWNEMVSGLGDVDRDDTQHSTARRLVGLKRYASGDIDPETGQIQFIVGMCLLASHLTSKDFPAKVLRTAGVYLMFEQKPCTGPKRFEYCQAIVKEVRDLHAKLLEKAHTIEDVASGRLGVYR